MSLPSSTVLNYIYNTPESVHDLLAALKYSKTLFFDCEGVNLGKKGGSITLMSFGTPEAPGNVHLVQVPPIGRAALRPIFNLLESKAIQKVMFDGRSDQSALFYDCGKVTLRNVVDLQIADIEARRRNEPLGLAAQLNRLVPYLPFGVVNGSTHQYKHVHRLNGLVQASEEHGQPVDEAFAKEKKQLVVSLDWAAESLSDDHIRYAAYDIALISQLWAHFAQNAYITTQVREHSATYVALWLTTGQPKLKNKFLGHALLPLGILDETSKSRADKHFCTGCRRQLPIALAARTKDMDSRSHSELGTQVFLEPLLMITCFGVLIRRLLLALIWSLTDRAATLPCITHRGNSVLALPTMPPILHNTPDSIPALLEALQNSQTLFFDCEGVNLGTKGGSLTVMSFGTPQSPDDAHIVHVPPLDGVALRPIFDLLESETIQKVVFDGRMDQSALFYGFGGVRLRNVVDLQIADVKSRLEDEPLGSFQQLDRLIPYLPYREVMGAKDELYQNVHKLSGLAHWRRNMEWMRRTRRRMAEHSITNTSFHTSTGPQRCCQTTTSTTLRTTSASSATFGRSLPSANTSTAPCAKRARNMSASGSGTGNQKMATNTGSTPSFRWTS
uniref:3'-5' exonuclease n=1 Tax=Mycena chlorophos TaxID=658473 RepID=A0ABQ0L8I6_MYCCL|nr:3'-5' exonuclease [Mycena chlorophos]